MREEPAELGIQSKNPGQAQGKGRPDCVEGTPGCYGEYSPQEFNRHKELVVVLMKAAHAEAEFEGFHTLISVGNSREVPARLAGLAADQPIGLVCPDGDCSGRLAIRLSSQGFRVYHLGGGLREWYHSFGGVTGGAA